MMKRQDGESQSVIHKIDKWFKLRKDTTPAHWTFGGFCGGISIVCFWVGFALMIMFALFEWWNDKCGHTQQGDVDWWEAFLFYCIVFFTGFIISLFGIIRIGWWPS